ncbi:tyrosine-type recombinase/integrase [Nitrospira sp. M1]
MAGHTRVLTRREEAIFTYRLVDGTERFAVRMEHQGKDWRKFGFPTLTKARQWRDSRKGRSLEGRLFPEQEQAQQMKAQNSIPLFGEYAQTWLITCRTRALKYTTLLRYKGHVNKQLVPTLGHLRLDEIKRGHVRQLASSMTEDGASPKTIHNVIRALSAIFTQANEDEIVGHHPARNPSKLIRLRKNKKVEVFTMEEEQEILKTAQKNYAHYFPFILFLFRTGVREGEAVALMPEDVNFLNHTASIERNFTAGHLEDSPKNGRGRTIDVSRDLTHILKNLLVIYQAEEALHRTPRAHWLFTSTQGDIIRSNNFRDRVWRPLLKDAGVRYRNVHTTRHTFATRMIMAGANLVYVQRQLGHSSIKITVDLYTHWIEEIDRGQRAREVDRLATYPEKDEAGTLAGTSLHAGLEVVEEKREILG